MKLLLTSSGFFNTSLEKDFLEMTEYQSNLTVAIIPTASDPIEWIPENEGDLTGDYIAHQILDRDKIHEKWLFSYQEEWEKKGYTVIVADLKDDPAILQKKLENIDIIDVLGGDVNWLLDWVKKSKLDTYLHDLLLKGVIYVGASAGSMICTPDIGLTWWEPHWKLDHIGLGLVDFLIVAHQNENDEQKNRENLIRRREYLQSIQYFPWKMYLLQDGQAIKVIGERVEHIGPGIKNSFPSQCS